MGGTYSGCALENLRRQNKEKFCTVFLNKVVGRSSLQQSGVFVFVAVCVCLCVVAPCQCQSAGSCCSEPLISSRVAVRRLPLHVSTKHFQFSNPPPPGSVVEGGGGGGWAGGGGGGVGEHALPSASQAFYDLRGLVLLA